jgi:hypothetical protein
MLAARGRYRELLAELADLPSATLTGMDYSFSSRHTMTPNADTCRLRRLPTSWKAPLARERSRNKRCPLMNEVRCAVHLWHLWESMRCLGVAAVIYGRNRKTFANRRPAACMVFCHTISASSPQQNDRKSTAAPYWRWRGRRSMTARARRPRFSKVSPKLPPTTSASATLAGPRLG